MLSSVLWKGFSSQYFNVCWLFCVFSFCECCCFYLLSGFIFKVVKLLNFRWCSLFFVDASFTLSFLCISMYSFFHNYCLSIPLVWSILMFVSLIVLSQKETTSFIKSKEKSVGLEYQLSLKLWSQFPIVGSSFSSRPLGTSLLLIHWDRKSLWEVYLADFSLICWVW